MTKEWPQEWCHVSVTVGVTTRVGGCRSDVGKVSITVSVTARVGGCRSDVGKVDSEGGWVQG